MTVSGPDFIALHVRDLQRAAEFYETHLGLHRAPSGPPGAIVFNTNPAAFAVREALSGVDSSPRVRTLVSASRYGLPPTTHKCCMTASSKRG